MTIQHATYQKISIYFFFILTSSTPHLLSMQKNPSLITSQMLSCSLSPIHESSFPEYQPANITPRIDAEEEREKDMLIRQHPFLSSYAIECCISNYRYNRNIPLTRSPNGQYIALSGLPNFVYKDPSSESKPKIVDINDEQSMHNFLADYHRATKNIINLPATQDATSLYNIIFFDKQTCFNTYFHHIAQPALSSRNTLSQDRHEAGSFEERAPFSPYDIIDDIIPTAHFAYDELHASHRTINLWDLHEDKLMALYVKDENISALAFSPNGNYLALGLHDGTIKIWDMEQNSLSVILLYKHRDPIAELLFSPNNQILASRSVNAQAKNNIEFWHIDSNNAGNSSVAFRCKKRGYSKNEAFSFYPDSSVALMTGYAAWIFHDNDQVEKVIRSKDQKQFHALANKKISLNNEYEVSWKKLHRENSYEARQYKIRLINKETGITQDTFITHCQVSKAEFSPDNRYLVLGFTNGAIKTWDLERKTSHDLTQGSVSLGKIISLSFSPYGRYLMALDNQNNLIIAKNLSAISLHNMRIITEKK